MFIHQDGAYPSFLLHGLSTHRGAEKVAKAACAASTCFLSLEPFLRCFHMHQNNLTMH